MEKKQPWPKAHTLTDPPVPPVGIRPDDVRPKPAEQVRRPGSPEDPVIFPGLL